FQIEFYDRVNPASYRCGTSHPERQRPLHTRHLGIEIVDRAVAVGDVEVVSHIRLVVECDDVPNPRRHLQRLQLHMMHNKSVLGSTRGLDRHQHEKRNTNRSYYSHVHNLVLFCTKAISALPELMAARATSPGM